MSITQHVLFEDKHIRLIHRPGSSQFSLVTFSNYGFNPDAGKIWGQTFVDRENWDTYGFVAKGNNWFPSSSVLSSIAQAKLSFLKPVITYGHSLGGYAALKYSRALGASSVISGAPQYSIDPSHIADDPRFRRDFKPDIHTNMEISADDLEGNVIIVVDPYFHLDMIHLRRILDASSGKRVHILPLHYIGHNVMEALSDRNVISGLLSPSFSAANFREVKNIARSIKKRSHSYSYHLASKLLEKNRPFVANQVLREVEKRSGLRGGHDLLSRHLFVSSKVSLALGNHPAALKFAYDAQEKSGNDPRFVLWVSICLARVGQWDDALRRAEELLLRPEVKPILLPVQTAIANIKAKIIPNASVSI